MLYLGTLFLAKVLDNALSTTKTILIQRSRWVLAGIAVILSDFLYFWITKRIVSADSMLALAVVAAAGGVGCSLACLVSDKLSKDRTYVNVIMSDNLEASVRLLSAALSRLVISRPWRKRLIHGLTAFRRFVSWRSTAICPRMCAFSPTSRTPSSHRFLQRRSIWNWTGSAWIRSMS